MEILEIKMKTKHAAALYFYDILKQIISWGKKTCPGTHYVHCILTQQDD